VTILASPQVDIASPSASRTLVIAVEIDRDSARLIGYTTKARPFVAPRDPAFDAPASKALIEVALLGPGGARYTQHVAVSGLCLAHGPDTPPEIAGDTIRLHRESVLVEAPEIAGFDHVEVAYGSGQETAAARTVLGTLALDAARYTPAGGTISYGQLAIAQAVAAPAPLTPGTIHFPEEYGDPDVYTVYGDPAETNKRINIVIVPDGYTYPQKATMQAHAEALVAAFRAKTPFKEHDRFVNYVLVYAYSNKDGTDQCDCSIVRDTAMSTRFLVSTPICGHSDNRCLYYGGGCDTDTSNHIPQTELRAPAHDETIVMVNTDRYGGCGGERAVYSAANSSATEIAIHELGHSLAGLADEYGGTPSCGSGGGVNVSMNPSTGSWPEWIPDIGAPWQGAQYYEQCIYRPTANCEMRTLGPAFCPVCLQQWVLTFFGHPRVSPTAPIESKTPSSPLDTDMVTSETFSLVTRLASGPGVTSDITWQLQGPGFPTATTVATGTESYTRTFTAQGTYTLTSRVVADTNLVKPQKYAANSELVSWTVRVCDPSGQTTAVNNGPICAGAALQLTAMTLPGATYAWTGPSGFQSTAQSPAIPNASASASGDYTVTISTAGCLFSATTTATVIAPGAPCDDGDACSQSETCQSGSCIAGSVLNCDDGDLCTVDGCASSSCTHAPVACAATDQCHPFGFCSPASGTCSYPISDFDHDAHGAAACGGDDCNDANAQVWLLPIEVTQLRAAGKNPTTLSWDDQRPIVGPATTYNLVSGTLLGAGVFPYGSSTCLSVNTGGYSFLDTRPDPAAGQLYWYMNRARNACGPGTYGTVTADEEMNPCP